MIVSSNLEDESSVIVCFTDDTKNFQVYLKTVIGVSKAAVHSLRSGFRLVFSVLLATEGVAALCHRAMRKCGLRLPFCPHLVFVIEQLSSSCLEKASPTPTFPQLVIKLHTKSGADHFLEACSREERDNWAEDITSAVTKLGVAGGDKGTDQDDPAGSQLNNINLR